jgi:hypothetical protein
MDDFLFLGDVHVGLGILSSCIIHRPSYFTRTILLYFSFLYFLVGFNRRIMQICGDIMGLRSWESFQGPLARCQVRLPISFGGTNLLSMEDCAPFTFLGSWVLVILYLYSRFHIFNKPVLEKYVFQVEGGPHLFKSCLRATWYNLLLATRDMYFFFF